MQAFITKLIEAWQLLLSQLGYAAKTVQQKKNEKDVDEASQAAKEKDDTEKYENILNNRK
jgi:hypothetical protein